VYRARTVRRGAVLALAAAVLVACGSSDSGDGSADGAAADAGEPQSGGTATIIQHSEPRTLDPALISNTVSVTTLVGNALYGQLVRVQPGETELDYGLAESLESSDGGTTWTLTLREGLTFSDGSPLDAAAVQFNWERLADPTVAPSIASYAALVDTMSADGQALSFTLVRPIAQFGYTVARNSMNWIASPAALEGGNQAFDQDPVGAGPFVLESWQRQGQMVLTRNDAYWDAPRPYLDELVLIANPDGNQRLSTVMSGGADAATSSAQDLRVQAADQGLNVDEDESGDVITLVMNTRTAPFDDIRARQALTQAIDFDAVNAAAFGGGATIPTTVFPPDTEFNGDTTLPEYDPDAAQELFDELAADGKPVEFTLTAIQTTENRRTNEALQAQLSQYDNVTVELEVLDYAAWATAQAQRSFQVIAGGVGVDALSLYQTLHSDSPGNLSGLEDAELDAALEALLTATDEAGRTQAFQDVAARYADLALTVSYSDLDNAVLHTDRLHGIEWYSHGALRVDTLWVSE
jgi:peptide/nickel transport system substrate-binding protein